ncbi:hypothetical protein BJD62_gp58 [Gordonia phage Lucky10]|uniref:Uncharacterized protein n=1 Tax=Gordonia phage Lucky10 TaxID=1821557 RepID=A0A142KB18_9CAUD|nr:hypothetical protein BJD62_gp58 [Gordonia phage Lucky10]AMS03301.1 hypothetical protein SEA_LUCKY10_58 [Gordonia phage Lucky10]
MSDIGFGPVGDPPIIYDTSTTDGYGRVTQLVDRRLLEQAQAWAAWLIAEQEHEYETALDELERERDDPCSQTNQNAAAWRVVASHPLIGAIEKLPERGTYAEMVRARLDALAAERDHWRAEAEKARTPDAGNPAHLRSVADLLERVINVRRSPNTCPDLRAAADRLESEATADDVVEPYSRDGYNAAQRIENAAREIAKTRGWDWINGPLHHREACWRDARALHSAGLLRGES